MIPIKLNISQKLLHISPAYNDTFVLLQSCRMKKDKRIRHVNHKGQTLKEVVINTQNDDFHMLSDREVIFVERESQKRQKSVSILNLKDNTIKQKIKIPEENKNDRLQLQTFRETRLLLLKFTNLLKQELQFYHYGELN